jgi:hypothetical protein
MPFENLHSTDSIGVASFATTSDASFVGTNVSASGGRIIPTAAGGKMTRIITNGNGKYFAVKVRLTMAPGIRVSGWRSDTGAECFIETRKVNGKYYLYTGFDGVGTQNMLMTIPTAPRGQSTVRPWVDGQDVTLVLVRTSAAVEVYDVTPTWQEISKLEVITDGTYGGGWDSGSTSNTLVVAFNDGVGELRSLYYRSIKKIFDYSEIVYMNSDFSQANGVWAGGGLTAAATHANNSLLVVSANQLTTSSQSQAGLFGITSNESPTSQDTSTGMSMYFRFQYISGPLGINIPGTSSGLLKINSTTAGYPLAITQVGKSETVVASSATGPASGQYVHVLVTPSPVKGHGNQYIQTRNAMVWVSATTAKPFGSAPLLNWSGGMSAFTPQAPAIYSETAVVCTLDNFFCSMMFPYDMTAIYAQDSAVFNGTADPFVGDSWNFSDATRVKAGSSRKHLQFFDFYDKVYR